MTNLIEMRRAARLTQEQFWGRIGITQSGGSRYESGRILPEPITMLLTLAYGNEKQRSAMLDALAWRLPAR